MPQTEIVLSRLSSSCQILGKRRESLGEDERREKGVEKETTRTIQHLEGAVIDMPIGRLDG